LRRLNGIIYNNITSLDGFINERVAGFPQRIASLDGFIHERVADLQCVADDRIAHFSGIVPVYALTGVSDDIPKPFGQFGMRIECVQERVEKYSDVVREGR
jgi:hypothetical protein